MFLQILIICFDIYIYIYRYNKLVMININIVIINIINNNNLKNICKYNNHNHTLVIKIPINKQIIHKANNLSSNHNHNHNHNLII